ncbi:hypothetical protein KQX54_005527 [Cotesia glomerata]|uniref:Ig-like domain-containing protein n=1 Tax=Cotesia glomerata TaxID=32391 RepID=A0AAV7IPX7_COTGL|nr:hypothetical protein KQX54_005527 [Cotesia glomerata]
MISGGIALDYIELHVAWLQVNTQTILTIAIHVITKNHRIAVTHSDHRIWYLHIRDVRESDQGDYMCQINTDPMISQVGQLKVVVPPDILDYPTSTDMVVREGSNVTLRCAASGSPQPNITWKRESGEAIALGVNDEAVSSVNGSTLNITRVNRLHMGAYLCIASNGVPPSVSKRIMLIVHFPPMIMIQNQLVGAQEGQDMTLECDSEAYPKAINYWTRENDSVISNGISTTFAQYRTEHPKNYGSTFLLNMRLGSFSYPGKMHSECGLELFKFCGCPKKFSDLTVITLFPPQEFHARICSGIHFSFLFCVRLSKRFPKNFFPLCSSHGSKLPNLSKKYCLAIVRMNPLKNASNAKSDRIETPTTQPPPTTTTPVPSTEVRVESKLKPYPKVSPTVVSNFNKIIDASKTSESEKRAQLRERPKTNAKSGRKKIDDRLQQTDEAARSMSSRSAGILSVTHSNFALLTIILTGFL